MKATIKTNAGITITAVTSNSAHADGPPTMIFIGYENGGIVQLVDSECADKTNDFSWNCFSTGTGNIATMSIFGTMKMWCDPLVDLSQVKLWLLNYNGTREYNYEKLCEQVIGRAWVPAMYYPVMEAVTVSWG